MRQYKTRIDVHSLLQVYEFIAYFLALCYLNRSLIKVCLNLHLKYCLFIQGQKLPLDTSQKSREDDDDL